MFADARAIVHGMEGATQRPERAKSIAQGNALRHCGSSSIRQAESLKYKQLRPFRASDVAGRYAERGLFCCLNEVEIRFLLRSCPIMAIKQITRKSQFRQSWQSNKSHENHSSDIWQSRKSQFRHLAITKITIQTFDNQQNNIKTTI